MSEGTTHSVGYDWRRDLTTLLRSQVPVIGRTPQGAAHDRLAAHIEALEADLDTANTNLHTALVAMRSARDERDKYEEEAHAANARADEAEACDLCASMGDLQERLADALANRDLWRKRAIHIAGAAAEASNPTHFATVDGVAESTAMHLASAMYSLDDGTLFLYPANALAAAREAVRHE